MIGKWKEYSCVLVELVACPFWLVFYPEFLLFKTTATIFCFIIFVGLKLGEKTQFLLIKPGILMNFVISPSSVGHEDCTVSCSAKLPSQCSWIKTKTNRLDPWSVFKTWKPRMFFSWSHMCCPHPSFDWLIFPVFVGNSSTPSFPRIQFRMIWWISKFTYQIPSLLVGINYLCLARPVYI